MFYDRKIKYLDYIENGQRLRNGGFVKFEVRDDKCCITLQVSGLRTMEHHCCKVYLISAQKKEFLCEIPLQQGKGNVQSCVMRRNLCGGIAYEQLESVQIPISPGRELRCTIAERRVESESVIREETREEMKPELTKEIQQETKHEEKQKEKQEEKQEPITENTIEIKSELKSENIKMENTTTEDIKEEREIEKKAEQPVQRNLLEDKWEQITAIYPHIRPFRDEREYLSVGPGDFVILSQKYYRLVNNSFLLHGFYNYKHLILTCMEVKGEKCYYIGVPGNFYEREKQVALMFGFESFECREEPAGMGDFGYYMMRVEI